MAKVFQSASALEMREIGDFALRPEHAVESPKSASVGCFVQFQLDYIMYFKNANVSFCWQQENSMLSPVCRLGNEDVITVTHA